MALIFTSNTVDIIRRIPRGKVATYGSVAAMAGNSRAARQVVRVLHIYSKKEGLPWYRVINREGKISLKKGEGYEKQKSLLEGEGIQFDLRDRVDLKRYLWTGE